MEYKVNLTSIAADKDKEFKPYEATSLMLFAIAERLERIAELMERWQDTAVIIDPTLVTKQDFEQRFGMSPHHP